jgi:hypothetical protein
MEQLELRRSDLGLFDLSYNDRILYRVVYRIFDSPDEHLCHSHLGLNGIRTHDGPADSLPDCMEHRNNNRL